MGVLELLLLAVGLAMDAFAVAICKGLASPRITLKNALTVGLWFGGFQALMPTIGYLVGSRFAKYIVAFDHWIVLFLLVFIGGNMIREALTGEDEDVDASMGFQAMLLLALATSIDALAAGITFAFLPDTNIVLSIAAIGVITCVISMFGFKIGNVFGSRYKSKAEFAGGVILILLGVKILLEHLGILVL